LFEIVIRYKNFVRFLPLIQFDAVDRRAHHQESIVESLWPFESDDGYKNRPPADICNTDQTLHFTRFSMDAVVVSVPAASLIASCR
jgi:hypothetical protein